MHGSGHQFNSNKRVLTLFTASDYIHSQNTGAVLTIDPSVSFILRVYDFLISFCLSWSLRLLSSAQWQTKECDERLPVSARLKIRLKKALLTRLCMQACDTHIDFIHLFWWIKTELTFFVGCLSSFLFRLFGSLTKINSFVIYFIRQKKMFDLFAHVYDEEKDRFEW
jgi:hypothetical protein